MAVDGGLPVSKLDVLTLAVVQSVVNVSKFTVAGRVLNREIAEGLDQVSFLFVKLLKLGEQLVILCQHLRQGQPATTLDFKERSD